MRGTVIFRPCVMPVLPLCCQDGEPPISAISSCPLWFRGSSHGMSIADGAAQSRATYLGASRRICPPCLHMSGNGQQKAALWADAAMAINIEVQFIDV